MFLKRVVATYGKFCEEAYIREIQGAELRESVSVGEREVRQLEKADKGAELDDESGSGNSLVVVAR